MSINYHTQHLENFHEFKGSLWTLLVTFHLLVNTLRPFWQYKWDHYRKKKYKDRKFQTNFLPTGHVTSDGTQINFLKIIMYRHLTEFPSFAQKHNARTTHISNKRNTWIHCIKCLEIHINNLKLSIQILYI